MGEGHARRFAATYEEMRQQIAELFQQLEQDSGQEEEAGQEEDRQEMEEEHEEQEARLGQVDWLYLGELLRQKLNLPSGPPGRHGA